jgi:ABC-type phosphate transport system substrate-binding protein
MRTTLKSLLASAHLLVASIGSALALDGAIIIAHPSVAADTLDAAALKDLYTGKKMFWDGGKAVVIVVLASKTDAALAQVSGMEANAFKTHWQRLGFSGRGLPPKRAETPEALVSTVASTPGAIAIAPTDAALKDVKKIEVK